MDDYTENYTPIDFDFKAWIEDQKNDGYQIVVKDDRHIELQTDYATAYINFYDLGIVEISIVSARDHTDHFNLHFQLNDERHAKKLFREMVDALFTLQDLKEIRILLSCSGGLTTSYFADMLNQAAKEAALSMRFDAVGYMELYEKAPGYDAILLAPQIGYLQKKLQGALPQKPVIMIPTAMFASFNAPTALEFIQKDVLPHFTRSLPQENKEICDIENSSVIASIGTVMDLDKCRLYYRVYDHGKIVLDEMTVKPIVDWQDTDDIINYILTKYPKLDMIGLATPGIVEDGRYIEFTNPRHIVLRTYRDHVEKKYRIPCLVANNCNATVEGFHCANEQYHNIIYHSQPYGQPGGGQGYIVNDQLLQGTRGQSGEFKFFIKRMQYSDEPKELAKSDIGMLELVSKSLLPAISILGPEVVAVRSAMTNDMNELKKKIGSFIPEEYLPEFVYVDDPKDYLLDGMLCLCLDAMQKGENVLPSKLQKQPETEKALSSGMPEAEHAAAENSV